MDGTKDDGEILPDEGDILCLWVTQPNMLANIW